MIIIERLEGNTIIRIRIETYQRVILREICEEMYGDHDTTKMLEKVCDLAVKEFIKKNRKNKN